MRATTITILLLCLAPAAWGSQPLRRDIGDFPACNMGRDGLELIAKDPLSDTDCTTGGGTSAQPHPCWCDGSATTWVSAPSAGSHSERVRLETSGTLTAGSLTVMTWTIEVEDTDTMFDVANLTRITFTTGGTYVVTGSLSLDASGYPVNGTLRLNGTTTLDVCSTEINTTTGYDTACSVHSTRTFSAADYVELLWQADASGQDPKTIEVAWFAAARIQ